MNTKQKKPLITEVVSDCMLNSVTARSSCREMRESGAKTDLEYESWRCRSNHQWLEVMSAEVPVLSACEGWMVLVAHLCPSHLIWLTDCCQISNAKLNLYKRIRTTQQSNSQSWLARWCALFLVVLLQLNTTALVLIWDCFATQNVLKKRLSFLGAPSIHRVSTGLG